MPHSLLAPALILVSIGAATATTLWLGCAGTCTCEGDVCSGTGCSGTIPSSPPPDASVTNDGHAEDGGAESGSADGGSDVTCCAPWNATECGYRLVSGVCNACCKGDVCGLAPESDGPCSSPVGPAGSPCFPDGGCENGELCGACYGRVGCFPPSMLAQCDGG